MSDEDMAKFEKKKRGRDHSLARGNSTHKNSFLSQRLFFGTIWGSRLKIVPKK
jgi:hypothetical protein